jgi:hypothetical protein
MTANTLRAELENDTDTFERVPEPLVNWHALNPFTVTVVAVPEIV